MSVEPDPAAPRVALADYERAAAAQLDPGALGYYAGGAGDELTLAENVAAWQRLELLPRVLRGVGHRELSVTVLGRERRHPLIVAPMAFQRMAHPDGEAEMARGAAAADAPLCLSTLSTVTPEAVAAAAPTATRWFQLYVFRDRGVSRELAVRARESGYEALVVTVDLPVMGSRDRDARSGVSAPATGVASARAAGARGPLTPAGFAGLIDPELSWADVEHFASEAGLPLLVKGILHPEDARLAAEHGAAGVIVSNHGGRQLDTALATARALPAVVEAAGDRLEVLADGGIRRGTDVAKALALGARAVLVGRPVLWGLAVEGAAGATRVLEILRTELDLALALLGVARARDLDASVLAR